MNIIIKEPLKTLPDENAPWEEPVTVFPGEYELVLVQMKAEGEMFFFLEEQLEGVSIGKTILYGMERIGLVEIADDEKFSGLTTNFPPENTMTVANMAGCSEGRPFF